MNNFYVYIYLDPRKPGKFIYDDLYLEYEPFYVGKGVSERINLSKYDKLNSLKTNKVNKIEKSGLKIISYKLFDNLTETESLNIERNIIKKIGKLINETGPLVNFSDGGTGGDNISKHPNRDVIVEKMKASKLGEKNSFYGKKHTEITKQKLSEISSQCVGSKNPFFGKKHTTETKKMQSDVKKNKYDGEKNPFYGKKHNEETKNILREKATNRKHSEETKLKIGHASLGKRTGINNPSATKYVIQTPQGEVLEFIGIKNLDFHLKGVNPRRILKQKEHKGYKLLNIIKLNKQ